MAVPYALDTIWERAETLGMTRGAEGSNRPRTGPPTATAARATWCAKTSASRGHPTA